MSAGCYIERLTYDERAVTQCRVWRVTCHYHTMSGQSRVEVRVAAIHSHVMTAVMKLRHVEETVSATTWVGIWDVNARCTS